MTKIDINAAVEALNEATHYDALWERFISYLGQMGADLITYHHIAPHHAPDAGRVDILSYGYPSAWEQFCHEAGLSDYNPIFNMGYTRTDNFRWGEILDHPKYKDSDTREKKFIDSMKEWMKGDGYMIPVFGPSGRNGYIAAGNLASIEDWTPDSIQTMKCLSQEFHLRYVKLILSELPSQITLDDQEHEILKQTAMGQGPQSIADIMGLKRETVESSIDRLMLTMSVGDLPSLMVRAQSLGLIELGALDPKI